MAPPRSIVMGSVNTTPTQITQTTRQIIWKLNHLIKIYAKHKFAVKTSDKKWQLVKKHLLTASSLLLFQVFVAFVPQIRDMSGVSCPRNMWGTAVEIRYNICRQQDMPQFAMQHSKFNIHVYSAVHLIRVGGLVLGTLYLESHQISNSLDHHQLLAGFYYILAQAQSF